MPGIEKTSANTNVLRWFSGGEGGIWTLACFNTPTPLAGAPLRPLEYFSGWQNNQSINCKQTNVWRRGWDSNPWPITESPVFKTGSLNRSDTSPKRYKPHKQELFYPNFQKKSRVNWTRTATFSRKAITKSTWQTISARVKITPIYYFKRRWREKRSVWFHLREPAVAVNRYEQPDG